MNCKLFNAMIFAAGAVIGSAVTWKVLKTKYDKEYEQKYQEEVKEAKAFYKKKAEATVEEDKPVYKVGDNKPDIMEYAAKIQELGYKENAANEGQKYVRKEEDSMENEPYVITEEEFDEAGYDTETLTYYADGVLTDWFNDPVDEPDSLVGPGTLEHFNELADGDTVFVRNDNHMTDYEIQRDHRNYWDAFPESTEE